MVALGMLLRSVSLVFIFTPLFIVINVLKLKAIEEPELERRLGKHYVEYKGNVPMFIPKNQKEVLSWKKQMLIDLFIEEEAYDLKN